MESGGFGSPATCCAGCRRRTWTSLDVPGQQMPFTELFDEHIVLDSRQNPVPDLPAVSVGRDEAINTAASP
jgi:hypothetical protein